MADMKEYLTLTYGSNVLAGPSNLVGGGEYNLQAKLLSMRKTEVKAILGMLDRPDCNLSFSGLKTALMRMRDQVAAEKNGLTRQDRADLCAGFQAAVVDVLTEKTRRAIRLYLEENPITPTVAVAGGVNPPPAAVLTRTTTITTVNPPRSTHHLLPY